MNISLTKAVIGLSVLSAVISSFITAAVLRYEFRPSPEAVASKTEAAAPKPAPVEAKPAPAPEINVEQAMQDRFLGSEDAPMTIIEYASMTCDHCAAFHNQVMPEIRKELVETGKARLIYRDMPWDKYALKAAKMTRCAPPEKYFELVDKVFKTHDDWAHLSDPLKGLYDIGIAAGMEDGYLRACFDSEPLEKAIIEKQQEARKTFNINSTPSFVFMKDGARQEHYPEFEELAKKLGEHKH